MTRPFTGLNLVYWGAEKYLFNYGRVQSVVCLPMLPQQVIKTFKM